MLHLVLSPAMGGRRIALLLATVVCLLLAGVGSAGAAAGGWRTSLVPGGDPTSFEGLAAVPGGQVWAVGGQGGGAAYDTPMAWRHDASGWQAYTIPVDLTGRWGYLTAIDGSSADDVWAVGHTTIQANGSPQPLVAHWDGTAWRVISQPFIPPDQIGLLDTVVASSPMDVWVGGIANNGVSQPLLWHFTGFFWTQVAVPVRNRACSGGSASVTAAASNGGGLFVALRCPTVTTHDAGIVMRYDGRRWHGVLKLKPGATVGALAAAPDGTVWAAGTTVNGSTATAAVWSGGAGGLTPVTTSAIAGTTGEAVAVGPAGEVIVAGEHRAARRSRAVPDVAGGRHVGERDGALRPPAVRRRGRAQWPRVRRRPVLRRLDRRHRIARIGARARRRLSVAEGPRAFAAR